MNRRRWIIVAVIVLVVAAVVFARSRLSTRSEGPQFRTAAVTRGNLLISVSASGTIDAVYLVDVRSRATGQVMTVRVEEGDRVQKGQLLVEIDDPDALASLDGARNALAAARARLAQAESQAEIQRAATVTQVKQAEAAVAAARARLAQLRTPRPEEVAQAEEAVGQAQAAVDLARQNLQRQEQLFADGFISRSQLDQARNQDQVAQSQLRAAQLRLQQVRTGASPQEIDVAKAQLQQAEAQLTEARNSALQQTLRQHETEAARAQVASAAADVRQAEDRVGETRITAPVSGVVVKRSVSVGQSVIGGNTGGTPVVTIAQTSPVLARVFVDEADIARVTTTAQVEITADALRGTSFPGKVIRIAPQPVVEQNVTQYPVTVEVDDPNHKLMLGMTVDAEFVLARRTDVLLVPQEAVRGNETKSVFLVQGDKLIFREIQTGLSDGRFVEVTRGLRESETVYLGTTRSTSPPPSGGSNPFQPRFPPRR